MNEIQEISSSLSEDSPDKTEVSKNRLTLQCPHHLLSPVEDATAVRVGYLNRFADNQKIFMLQRDMQRSGTLIFKPSDINKTVHPIGKILRMMFVEQKITDRYLRDMNDKYCTAIGKPTEGANATKNNLRKAIYKSEATYTFFENTCTKFDAAVVDVAATVRIHTGEIFIYRKYKHGPGGNFPIICVEDLVNQDDTYPKDESPLYTKEDVRNCTHPIALFIQMYCCHQKLSREAFYFIFHEYFHKLGYDSNHINAHRNNSIRQFFISHPTFKAWEKFNTIMGTVLLDLCITIRHNDGTIVNYAVSDAPRIIAAYQYLEEEE